MLIWVISLFTLVVCCCCSSSSSESESVASWSVTMIRRSLLWVLVLVLHGGSSSKWELGDARFMGWCFSFACTDMPKRVFLEWLRMFLFE